MNLKKTALLIVDAQNDFLSPDGKMHEAVKSVLDANDMPNRLNKLIRVCRNRGVRIIFTPLTFAEGCPEAGEAPYGIMAPVAQSGAFIQGTWGAEIADDLDISDNDTVVEKHRICSFEGTNLESTLQEAGIERLFVAGLLTDVCVEATVRLAYDKGFEVYTITDATATIEPEKQKHTVETNLPLFSKPILHTEFTEILNTQPV